MKKKKEKKIEKGKKEKKRRGNCFIFLFVSDSFRAFPSIRLRLFFDTYHQKNIVRQLRSISSFLLLSSIPLFSVFLYFLLSSLFSLFSLFFCLSFPSFFCLFVVVMPRVLFGSTPRIRRFGKRATFLQSTYPASFPPFSLFLHSRSFRWGASIGRT